MKVKIANILMLAGTEELTFTDNFEVLADSDCETFLSKSPDAELSFPNETLMVLVDDTLLEETVPDKIKAEKPKWKDFAKFVESNQNNKKLMIVGEWLPTEKNRKKLPDQTVARAYMEQFGLTNILDVKDASQYLPTELE